MDGDLKKKKKKKKKKISYIIRPFGHKPGKYIAAHPWQKSMTDI